MERWLGGTAGGQRSFPGVEAALAATFELVSQQDVPFLLREHERKYQFGCSDGTVWRRRA